MAEILSTLFFLALGFAIGWWIKRRFFAPVYAESDAVRYAREWQAHADAHAKSQAGSVAWTAPEAYVPLANGKRIPVKGWPET